MAYTWKADYDYFIEVRNHEEEIIHKTIELLKTKQITKKEAERIISESAERVHEAMIKPSDARNYYRGYLSGCLVSLLLLVIIVMVLL